MKTAKCGVKNVIKELSTMIMRNRGDNENANEVIDVFGSHKQGMSQFEIKNNKTDKSEGQFMLESGIISELTYDEDIDKFCKRQRTKRVNLPHYGKSRTAGISPEKRGIQSNAGSRLL